MGEMSGHTSVGVLVIYGAWFGKSWNVVVITSRGWVSLPCAEGLDGRTVDGVKRIFFHSCNAMLAQ